MIRMSTSVSPMERAVSLILFDEYFDPEVISTAMETDPFFTVIISPSAVSSRTMRLMLCASKIFLVQMVQNPISVDADKINATALCHLRLTHMLRIKAKIHIAQRIAPKVLFSKNRENSPVFDRPGASRSNIPIRNTEIFAGRAKGSRSVGMSDHITSDSINAMGTVARAPTQVKELYEKISGSKVNIVAPKPTAKGEIIFKIICLYRGRSAYHVPFRNCEAARTPATAERES